ncbi:MAG TPA: DUF4129 domain-containing protein [Steroidobacteraceae bacterium]
MNPHIGSLRLRLVLALVGLIVSTCIAAAPLDVVRECAASASPTLHGVKNLGTACPQLQAAIGTLGLDEILFEGWQDKLNIFALQDAVVLTERYSGSEWHGAPDTAELPAILQSLKDQQAPRVVSWWHSFKNWLKHWLDQSDSFIAKGLKHLLDNWLARAEVSSGVMDVFIYVVTILVAIGAVVVIVRELNAAGIGRRFRRMRPAIGADQNASNYTSQADEGSAADLSSPAGVLRALVRRLLQSGRLATERSLTHRELVARSSFDSEAQKTAFAGVARTAEAILYGSVTAAPEFLEQVTRRGRELLQQLSRSPGTP